MFLLIDAVTCLRQDDYTGDDDVYLVVKNGAPHTITVGAISVNNTKQLSAQVALSEEGPHTIEVWERDALTSNDLIGTVDLDNFTHNVEQQGVVDNGSANYKIWFTVVDESH
ncbi:hypothetical protein [Flavihumibacter petaseus]|uniref:Uncharacterized protein n=1 Tax=Flavihumibacter petaseus NBRC 106054 TaxID=1220578 RepID=A0A0E9N2J6_9BACT|nr:hypothetical protein [Flavihumibacter petaseus]GAO43550.1 hypothetical protein FPE01S_02_06550 [Flavihumibacter petaseus NBRC 106054]